MILRRASAALAALAAASGITRSTAWKSEWGFATEKACLARFGERRAREQARTVTTPAGAFFLDEGRLRFGDSVVFDDAEFCSQAPECDELTHRTVVSLVGPLATWKVGSSAACNGGPPYTHVRWHSIDASSGRAPDLSTLVTNTDLAVRIDAALAKEGLEADGRRSALAFAVASYDASSGRATFLIAARSPRYEPHLVDETVTVELTPTAELRIWIEAAARGRGQLARSRER
jgi:hypothetical protein